MDHRSQHQKYSALRLEADYKEMSADEAREGEALAWIEAEVDDALDSEFA